MEKEEEIAVLICGYPRPEGYPDHWVTVEEECADCGCALVRRPDPEVPENATKLCWECGMKRVEEEEKRGETPTFQITKQNKGLLKNLGKAVFTCDGCGGTFLKARADQEALDELGATYPDASPEECAILCGDCHDRFVAWEASQTRQ